MTKAMVARALGSAAPASRGAAPPSPRRADLLARFSAKLDGDPALEEAVAEPGELERRMDDIEAVDGDLDELACLGRVQGRLERTMARLDPKQVAAQKGLGATLTGLAAASARIRKGRPPETETPEVLATRRLVAVEEAAVARIGGIIGEEAEDFAVTRAACEAWTVETCGSVLGPLVVTRWGVVLDGEVRA